MEFRILGPLEVVAGGRPIDIGPPKQRSVLARLLISPNTVVSTDRLLEDLWPAQQPGGGVRSLHVHVSRLRRALTEFGTAPIVTQSPGYAIEVDPDSIDAVKFEHMWQRGRASLQTNPRHAAVLLRRALGLWRGPPLADFTYEIFAEAEIRRLEEARAIAVEDLIDADLALGDHVSVVARLEKLLAEDPLRERLWGQLMIALYQGDRQAEALQAFQEATRALGEGLGVEPSQRLQDLDERILLHDTTLLPPAVTAVTKPDLPLRLNSFVGRWKDQALVRNLLQRHRLVTITGVGGVGKTSLALETARTLMDDFPDGVWMARLDGLDLEELVPEEMGRALGLSKPDDRTLTGLQSFLKTREALLIIDSCEHLINVVASAADQLLKECPELHILATSREPLELDGENLHTLQPLDLPAIASTNAEDLRSSPSVQLFLDRARESSEGYEPQEADWEHIAHICHSVAGIPLALELAAARLKILSIVELSHHMDDQMGLLSKTKRNTHDRHHALVATMDWSYGLLSDEDQTLLRRACVFRNLFAIQEANSVCSDSTIGNTDVLDGVGRLVAASLVVVEDHGEVNKYRILEPVRQYGVRRLEQAGEDHRTRLRHADAYVAKVQEFVTQFEAGRLDHAIELVQGDLDNFREALRWTLLAGETALHRKLAYGLGDYWEAAGPRTEGYRWLKGALDASPEEATAERFDALDRLIGMAVATDNPVETLLRELDTLASALGSKDAIARAASRRGMYAWSRGNLAEAIDYVEQSLSLAKPSKDTPARLLTECLVRAGRFDEARAMIEAIETRDEELGRTRDYWLVENLGMLAYARGRLESGELLLEEAVRGFGRLGSRTGQMEAMTYLAWITVDLDKDARTELLAERALAMAREDSDVMIEANCLWLLARLELRRGNLAKARSNLEQCTRVARRRNERISLVLAIHVWADLAHTTGDAELAVRLFAAADRLLRSIPHIMPPSIGAGYEAALGNLRQTLGDTAFEMVWETGVALSLNDSLEMAVRLKPSSG